MMLINDISRLFGSEIRKTADEEGIPSGYRHMLMILAHRDGISQLELARCLHITSPTVSVTLSKMEQCGYITRRSNERDQRQTLVYLNEKGRQLEARCHQIAQETEKVSLNGFDEKEKRDFKEYLLRIYQNLGGNDGPFEEEIKIGKERFKVE